MSDEIAELRASRARLLADADERRRALERELHDGVMQQLVALGVNVQLASRMVETNASGLSELLDEMLQHVHETLDDVRALAWRIYPSLLLRGDLGEALRAAAFLLEVSAQVETSGARPPELDESIYFCCFELLQQAGGRAVVHVRGESDTVLFDVASNCGWENRNLREVADRVATLGRELVVQGTLVQALMPESKSTSAR